MINAKAIVTDGLKASLVQGEEFNFTKGKFGGFAAEANILYSGAKFGAGAGILMQSAANDYKFNVYKDTNNYVEMFYRSATDWGLKGIAASKNVFQLGSKNQIGPFEISDTILEADNPYTIDSGYVYKGGLTLAKNHIYFKYATGSIYQQSVYVGVKGGAGASYGSNTVLAVEGGDIWHQMGIFKAAEIDCRGTLYLKRIVPRSLIGASTGNIPVNDPVVIITSTTTTTKQILGGTVGQLLLVVNYSGKKINILRNDTAALVTAINVDHGALFCFMGDTWLCFMQGPTWSS